MMIPTAYLVQTWISTTHRASMDIHQNKHPPRVSTSLSVLRSPLVLDALVMVLQNVPIQESPPMMLPSRIAGLLSERD